MNNFTLEAILALFQNGERRYEEDTIFKATIDSLKAGLGVYAVLDHVLKDYAALREASAKNLDELKTLRLKPDTQTIVFELDSEGLKEFAKGRPENTALIQGSFDYPSEPNTRTYEQAESKALREACDMVMRRNCKDENTDGRV